MSESEVALVSLFLPGGLFALCVSVKHGVATEHRPDIAMDANPANKSCAARHSNRFGRLFPTQKYP